MRESKREREYLIFFLLLDYKNLMGIFVKIKRVIIVLFFDKLLYI